MAEGEIFIVDDNPANLALLAGILKGAGYLVRMAKSGRLTLQMLGNNPPELVMLDPAAYSESLVAARAQEMHRYLTQPFHLWEHVTALPGESTPYGELLETAAALLAI